MSKVSLNKIKNILSKPLDDLIFQAQTVHKKNFKSSSFQLASLISFNKKTLGGVKLKKIGRLIKEKTLKELQPFINNEP